MARIYAVYLDVFFMQNFLIDGLCLLGVKILLRERRKYGLLYLLFGALSGTVMGIAAFFFLPSFFLYQAVILLAVQPLMIVLALRPFGWRQFFKQMACCYILYFVMGGILEFLLVYLEQKMTGVLPWAVLLFSASLVGLHFLEKRRKNFCKCTLICGTKKAEAKAIFDSGNLLRDPYSHRPVSIVPQSWKKELEVAEGKIRLVPYQTVAGQRELMETTTIPLMLLHAQGQTRQFGPVAVGFASEKVFSGKPYQVILNKEYDI